MPFSFGKKYELLLLVLFILFVTLITNRALSFLKKDTKQSISESILSINKSCNESITQWILYRESVINQIVKNEIVVESTNALLAIEDNQTALLQSITTEKLRAYFRPILKANEDLGIFIISPGYTSLFSMRDENTGTPNLMSKYSKYRLDEVLFNGITNFIPPIPSDVPLPEQDKINRLKENTMFVVAPVYYQGEIIAALSIRFNIQNEYTQILKIGSFRKTGETVAIDARGYSLSSIKFPTNKNNSSYQILDVGNNPIGLYTNQNTDTIIEHTDYRGEKVLSALLWNEVLNMGILTKIDKKEAYGSYRFVRKMAFIVVGTTLFFAIVIFFTIINLRQRNERVWLNARLELEQKVTERTKELNEAIETKDRFFSILAHDLRQPFNGMLGLFDILLENQDQISDERKNLLLQSVYDSGKQLHRLLENLLSWARAQSNKIKIKPTEIILRGLISENIYLQKDQAQHKSIRIENKIPENLKITVGVNTFGTVIRNLISNAIKFTPENGTITIGAKKKQYRIEIYIQDTGVGIPENKLADLFKIDSKYTTKGTNKELGTGLGLTLCKEFIELNSGTIQVHSKLGQGSTFTLSLPIIAGNSPV